MKTFLLLTFILALLLLPQSCGIIKLDIQIGENDYRSLGPEEKKRILHANPNTLPDFRDKSAAVKLYEVNTDDIKAFASRSRLTWVHLWKPWCKNDDCVDISYLERLHSPYRSAGFRFLMVSRSYDFNKIESILDNTDFPYPILVMENARYGLKLQPAAERFCAEFGLETEDSWYDDLIFADTVLVFSGEITERKVLDSLNAVYSKGW